MLYDHIPARALAVYAHPDDPEVSCAGTLARWVAQGCEAHLVICNAGDKGSFDPATDPATLAGHRAEETAAAAAVIGLSGHEILGRPDGELENDGPLREQLVRRIRRLRPEIVICPDPTAVFFGSAYVNHHDHRAVGWAVLDAVAPAAGSPLYFPDAGPAHRVGAILLSGTLAPDAWIDVGEYLQVKIAALRCHRSQLGDGEEVVPEVVRDRAADAAAELGPSVTAAEGFRLLRLGVPPP